MRRLIIICAAVLVSGVGLSHCDKIEAQESSPPTVYRPKIGAAHPDFVLPRIDDGKPLRLSDYRGKKVLLIHFASW